MATSTSSFAPSGGLTGRFSRQIWLLLPFALAAVLLLPGVAGFPFPDDQSAFSDLAISHYPNGLYLRQSLLEGRFPLWNPQILSGAPFAANPLSGLWYPPGWPALLLPLPLGFNIMILLHLAWGGGGLYRLLRREGLVEWAALFGAAAFVLLPKLYAHYGAGHLTLLYAVPWTPWLLLAARKRGCWEAVILALIFLADPRWSVYAGLLWLGYTLALAGRVRFWPALRRLTGRSLLAGLLAAPLALPLLEFARLSTRSAMTAQDVLAFSLPPARLLGLLYPDFGGFHETMLYTGQALLALGVVALIGLAAYRWTRFWGWTALLALLWSLGPALPPVAWLARLPGLDLLRVPSRALFLLGLALVCLAAHAVHALASPQPLEPKRLRRLRLALAGLCALSLVLTLGVALVSGKIALNFAWGSGFLLVVCAWLFLRLNRKLAPGVWLAGLALMAGLDLGGLDRTLFASRPAAQVLNQGAEAAIYLAAKPGHFRVYSPSYSLPQQTAAYYGHELADGVDPLQLKSYVDYMHRATGVPSSGYSVTLPPLGSETAQAAGGPGSPGAFAFQTNAAYTPEAGWLAGLNVAYVASAFDIDSPGLLLETRLGETRIYKNTARKDRAWVEPVAVGRTWIGGNLGIISSSPEKIEFHANGPGRLVLTEIVYPGWRVSVDGQERPLLTIAGVLRAVELEAGEHTIVFAFRPLSVYAGLALCALALLFIAIHSIRMRRQPQ